MKTTPVQARNRKRLPARVSVEYSDGKTVSIPSPSLPAWLGYARNQGVADTSTHEFAFYDGTALMTITKGARR